ncbi:MAG: hypothetical protein IJ692_02805 [Alloprevotella sp.]|nr:hypothetical protein [Alloprevotella sp.]MBR1652303.1 hypothetical protein [Alloprevotella sp.]
MENKYLILSAQVISLLFSPFHMPVMAFFLLLFFSYMSLLPLSLKTAILVVVWLFTIALPRVSIFFYRKLNGWSRYHLGRRANRFVPYGISILCYAALLYMMYIYHMPTFTQGIIVGALAIQISCTIINNWVKVSTHAAAAGGCLGALLAFSAIFRFDPTSWLCLCVLLCGLVSTSRLVLRQHQLRDVGLGTLVGVLCGFFCIFFI